MQGKAELVSHLKKLLKIAIKNFQQPYCNQKRRIEN